jgi:hypothetical protein
MLRMGGDSIEIIAEREVVGGWSFDVRVSSAAVEARLFTLRLSWADYNLWSGDGSDRPEAVARGVMAFALSRSPAAELAPTFDAARLRRVHADADDAIPRWIGAA